MGGRGARTPETLVAMSRRSLLRSCVAGAAAWSARAACATARIDLYTNSDANIADFWSAVVKPAFEAAHPGVAIRVINARAGGGIDAIAARAVAALASRADPQFDYAESYDPLNSKAAMDAGLWTDWSQARLSHYGKLSKMGFETRFGLSYRGSQVLLAYDTTKLKPAAAPRTWPDLVSWIRRHPGQFIYNRPDKGGSGGNFVRRAIHEVNGRNPAAFTHENFSEAYAAQTLPPAWALLRSLAPSLYEKGAYTASNTASIQLLAQGVVTMVPAYSDQAQLALREGVLPPTTGLVQLSDLGFAGGFSQTVVPVNARNHAWALKLADFVLSPAIQARIVTDAGGLPGIDWKHLPTALQERYKHLIPESIPSFPRGKWAAAISDGWYREVAPNAPRR